LFLINQKQMTKDKLQILLNKKFGNDFCEVLENKIISKKSNGSFILEIAKYVQVENIITTWQNSRFFRNGYHFIIYIKY